MKIVLDDVRTESPFFRAKVQQAYTANVDDFSDYLLDVVKLHGRYAANAKSASVSAVAFASRLASHGERALPTASTVRSERTDESVLLSFFDAINSISQSTTKLFTQTENNFARPFELLQQKGLDATKKAKSEYDRAVKAYDDALSRHGSVKKDAPPEDIALREAELDAATKAMEDARFDYIQQLNELDITERYDTIEGLCTVVYSHIAHLKHSYEKVLSLEPKLKSLLSSVKTLRDAASKEQADLNAARAHMSPFAPVQGALKSGYLFVQSDGVRREWNQRYCVLWPDKLEFYRVNKDFALVASAPAMLLRGAPRPNDARRFVFEIVSPNSHFLCSAQSNASMNEWLEALAARTEALLSSQSAITASANSLIGSSTNAMSASTNDANSDDEGAVDKESRIDRNEFMHELQAVSGNEVCADCRSPLPTWYSLNHGVLVCIQCSGAHRSLSTVVSKVYSLQLDAPSDGAVALLRSLGNTNANSVLEADIPASMLRPTPVTRGESGVGGTKGSDADRQIRERFAKAKYATSSFVKRTATSTTTTTSSASHSEDTSLSSSSPSQPSISKQALLDAARSIDADANATSSTTATANNSASNAGNNITNSSSISQHLLMLLRTVMLGRVENEVNAIVRGDEALIVSANHDPNPRFERLEASGVEQAGDTLLHALCRRHHQHRLEKTEVDDEDPRASLNVHVLAATELLILNGAQVDRRNDAGQTALHVAAACGRLDVVRSLVRHRADENLNDDCGRTALQIAELALRRAPDVDVEDDTSTPIAALRAVVEYLQLSRMKAANQDNERDARHAANVAAATAAAVATAPSNASAPPNAAQTDDDLSSKVGAAWGSAVGAMKARLATSSSTSTTTSTTPTTTTTTNTSTATTAAPSTTISITAPTAGGATSSDTTSATSANATPPTTPALTSTLSGGTSSSSSSSSSSSAPNSGSSSPAVPQKQTARSKLSAFTQSLASKAQAKLDERRARNESADEKK